MEGTVILPQRMAAKSRKPSAEHAIGGPGVREMEVSRDLVVRCALDPCTEGSELFLGEVFPRVVQDLSRRFVVVIGGRTSGLSTSRFNSSANVLTSCLTFTPVAVGTPSFDEM